MKFLIDMPLSPGLALSHLEADKPKGGSYKATKTVVENPSAELLLKFDEFTAIG